MTDISLDRREFQTSLAKGAALLGLAGATTRADDKPADTKEDAPAEAEQPRSPETLIVELTKTVYPHENMTDDFLNALKSHVVLNLSYSEILDNFGLTTGDPPGAMGFVGLTNHD